MSEDHSINETTNLISKEHSEGQDLSPRCCPTRARYSLAIWAFLGFFCLYAMRVNLSVAIVAMTSPQNALNRSVKSCPADSTNSSKPASDYEFNWDPSTQGNILGAFFYGYLASQIVGGNIAEKFGGKWIFGGSIGLAAIFTLLTPMAARVDYRFLIAIRVLIGFMSGPAFPSAAALWGKWIPPLERSTIPPAAQTGTNVGIILTTPLVSLMSDSSFLGGWPSAFYVFGTIALIWLVLWAFFGFNSPDEHPRISKSELDFLHDKIKIADKTSTAQKRKTPWRKIATCVPLYGIAIMHICNNYIYYTLLTSLPTYFSTILNFDLHQNGLLSALPYVALQFSTLIIGRFVDYLRTRKIFTLTTIRKGQTLIGSLGTCGCLIAVGYTGCNHVSAVTFCVLAVGFIGFQQCGPIISHLDIASNYAGTLVGITNSLAAIPGFIGPFVVGAITNGNQTVEAWRKIFDISAGIGAVGCIGYLILFKGEEQEWNRIQETDEMNKDEMIH